MIWPIFLVWQKRSPGGRYSLASSHSIQELWALSLSSDLQFLVAPYCLKNLGYSSIWASKAASIYELCYFPLSSWKRQFYEAPCSKLSKISIQLTFQRVEWNSSMLVGLIVSRHVRNFQVNAKPCRRGNKLRKQPGEIMCFIKHITFEATLFCWPGTGFRVYVVFSRAVINSLFVSLPQDTEETEPAGFKVSVHNASTDVQVSHLWML